MTGATDGADAGLQQFPEGFFDRTDADDAAFYAPSRLVTHIDDSAIVAVGELYEELGIVGDVLDLMSSWISHFRTPPSSLCALGMNETELLANPVADSAVVHDLNRVPRLPFDDGSFDDVVCCVSVDYLVRPIDVFADVRRVLRPGGRFVCTFSNRCFPTKAIRGWLAVGDAQRTQLVELYFQLAGGFDPVVSEQRPTSPGGDPLYAVWAAASLGEAVP
jgi:hypothetical protein